MDNERKDTRRSSLSIFMSAMLNALKNISGQHGGRVICAGSLSARKESNPSRIRLSMKLKRGWKDTNFFLRIRTAHLLFFCMLVVFGATQQGAHAQAYFPGGPANWRPYGGYTNPDYNPKGPTPQIIAAGQVVSGAANTTSFFFDQLYGVVQAASYVGTWGYWVLPNPTNSLPCNQAFDQSVRENGFWSATGSHLGTSIWNATPYRIGNAISDAAINDLSPETGGHQFTGQLANLIGSSLPGAMAIGAIRPSLQPRPAPFRLPTVVVEPEIGSFINGKWVPLGGNAPTTALGPMPSAPPPVGAPPNLLPSVRPRPPQRIDLMGGPASQLEGYFCYDINFKPTLGKPGMVGDVFSMPWASGTVSEIVCTNPHPGLGAGGNTTWILEPLRVLEPGGKIFINCAPKNPAGSLQQYMGKFLRTLENCGYIQIKRVGCLSPRFRCLEMYRTGENGIPGRIFTPQEAGCVISYEITKLR